MIQIKHGEVLGKVSGGGGGVGDPLEREPEKVLRDVINEVVTIEAASDTYGVVIEPSGRAVDRVATDARRRDLRSGAAPGTAETGTS